MSGLLSAINSAPEIEIWSASVIALLKNEGLFVDVARECRVIVTSPIVICDGRNLCAYDKRKLTQLENL